MEEELFYLKDITTQKYHSIRGLTKSIEDATKFTKAQLHKRLGVAATHKNVFLDKLRSSSLVIEPVTGWGTSVEIISKIKYEPDDLLNCEGVYTFENEVIKIPLIYSEFRDAVPKLIGKGRLLRIEICVKNICGKINK